MAAYQPVCKRAVHSRGSSFLYCVPHAFIIVCINWNNKKVFWLGDSLITRLSAYLMPNSVWAVLDFQTFNWRTTCSFVHYKFLLPVHLSYAEFKHFYAADEETFWGIAHWCCLSAKPTFQSLRGLGDVVVCVHTVVFICFRKKFFQTSYCAMPTCCHSDNMCSFHLCTHTCPLHFLSVQGCKTESQIVLYFPAHKTHHDFFH